MIFANVAAICPLDNLYTIKAKFALICIMNVQSLVQWVSYQICKIACCACAGNAGNVFPATDFKGIPLVRDPGMHHGTCVMPWCMSGLLTGAGRENVPGIPGAYATRNFTYLARGPWVLEAQRSCLMHLSIPYRVLVTQRSARILTKWPW